MKRAEEENILCRNIGLMAASSFSCWTLPCKRMSEYMPMHFWLESADDRLLRENLLLLVFAAMIY